MTGVAAAAFSLLGAVLTRSSDGTRFASRLSLLPSALMVSVFMGAAAWLAGITLIGIILRGAMLFSCVYVAKIPTALFKSYLDNHSQLCLLTAVVGNSPLICGSTLEILARRPDIRVVYCGNAEFSPLQALTRDGKLDEIVLTGPVDAATISALTGLAVTLVRIFPQDMNCDAVAGPEHYRYGRWGAPAEIISNAPMRDWYAIYKRMIDITGSLIAIVLFSPILLACAIAIKLDSPGPIFFIQERIGYRNRRFRMFKFRSMRNDMVDKTGAKLTLRNDPRVTRVGHFLRRSSADELPQLFNVLLGDMSLVGPRPHPLSAKAGDRLYEDVIPNFYARYRMKPGITGLAQISGHRGNTETEQHLIDRFRSDQLYVSQWGPLTDIAILLRTVGHVFEGKNAF
jgi:exopolysaccharide biosynthesis polyprenyl glycosylphosphotransferase